MTTVLVVEDDVFLRDIFQRVLERAGFHVLTAAHGKEALASFHKGGVGLVLTDLMMPELDGFELIRTLKREAPAVPVIAVSVMNDMSNCRDTVVGLGAELALCKPVNPRELVRLVQQFALSPNGPTSIQ
jgi:CheY-like chemotaxis protein